MKRNVNSNQRGQSLIEYALLLILVALVAIPLVILFGGGIKNVFTDLFGGPETTQVVLTEVPTEFPTEEPILIPTTPPTAITSITQDFMARIMDFYNKNGKWPKTSGDKQFTDIGLRPNDWDNTVEGINWDPSGSTINLTVKKEDNIQMYVNDLGGNKLKVYSNWPIVCVATSGSCYYHTVAPGNEVDINSVVVVNTKKD
jgi:Flp pilus assembly pilin Flp